MEIEQLFKWKCNSSWVSSLSLMIHWLFISFIHPYVCIINPVLNLCRCWVRGSCPSHLDFLACLQVALMQCLASMCVCSGGSYSVFLDRWQHKSTAADIRFLFLTYSYSVNCIYWSDGCLGEMLSSIFPYFITVLYYSNWRCDVELQAEWATPESPGAAY